jgi:hypothetical protein
VSGAPIEQGLAGGDRRSLGRTEEVVAQVRADPARFPELFACLFSPDDVVRMRAGDAIEKVSRTHPHLLGPYRERLLSDVAAIDQPSVRWHLAQMLPRLALTAAERRRALAILRGNLARPGDRIVLACTLEALAAFARDDPGLRRELVPIIRDRASSDRPSVAKRAAKLLARLG